MCPGETTHTALQRGSFAVRMFGFPPIRISQKLRSTSYFVLYGRSRYGIVPPDINDQPSLNFDDIYSVVIYGLTKFRSGIACLFQYSFWSAFSV